MRKTGLWSEPCLSRKVWLDTGNDSNKADYQNTCLTFIWSTYHLFLHSYWNYFKSLVILASHNPSTYLRKVKMIDYLFSDLLFSLHWSEFRWDPLGLSSFLFFVSLIAKVFPKPSGVLIYVGDHINQKQKTEHLLSILSYPKYSYQQLWYLLHSESSKKTVIPPHLSAGLYANHSWISTTTFLQFIVSISKII